jgi:hypothetical protein
MPSPISFVITTAGRQAVLDAQNTGLTLRLTEFALGSGKYTPDDTKTALLTEQGRWPLSGGDVEPNSQTLRFSATIEAAAALDSFECGIFDENGVLFAVSSVTGTTPQISISPNIAFVASFGLALGDVSASAITIVTDPNAPLSVVLMSQHLAADNPHPQYADKAQNTLEHNNILSLITAANQARQNGDDYLLDLINSLNASIAGLYPKTIASGIFNQPTGGGSRYMLSATAGWSVGGTSLKDVVNTLGIDLTNVRYSISMTPEGSHEAWDITRKQNGFYLNIFNRSGTNRIGYNGNVNWLITETMPSGVDEGNGSYGPGSYSFLIYPNTSKLIRLWGGGGGGGASELSLATDTANAADGAATTFVVGTTTIGANGGTAATNGVWANGSAYSDGGKGLGGAFFFNGSGFVVSESDTGADGAEDQLSHIGGSSGRFGDYGRGGDGADGVGDEGYAYGGGGGEGGYIEFTYTNSGTDPVSIRVTVGAGGIGGKTNNNDDANDFSDNGMDGYAGFATVASV